MTAKSRASEIPPERVREIPNGVDLRRFRPASSPDEARVLRAKLGRPTRGPIIVFVGFFSRDKAPHVLFQAWRRLPPGPERPFLLLIGSTDPRHVEVDAGIVTEIRSAIDRGNLHDRVGFVEATNAVEEYLRAANIYVAPSRREGLSNALLEALACGLAVVAARIEGVTTGVIADGRSGMLVAPDDPVALAERLQALLDDESLRRTLGREARRLAESRYGIEAVAGNGGA
jgi:glycosyltransferase involved in cell wall biosynthesis